MSTPTTLADIAPLTAPRRLLRAVCTLSTAALLLACGGGGGGIAGVGTGGTGSFSVGTVTGFGSVFVNGVRYDDDGARLVDDDSKVTILGRRQPAARWA
jgi:hypothetical protein